MLSRTGRASACVFVKCAMLRQRPISRLSGCWGVFLRCAVVRRLLVSKSLIRCAICASSRPFLFGTAPNGRTEIFVQGDLARLAGCVGEVATDLEACGHGLKRALKGRREDCQGNRSPLSPPRSLAKDCTQRRDLFLGTHVWFFNNINLVGPGKDPAGKNQWLLISRLVAKQPWKRSRH